MTALGFSAAIRSFQLLCFSLGMWIKGERQSRPRLVKMQERQRAGLSNGGKRRQKMVGGGMFNLKK